MQQQQQHQDGGGSDDSGKGSSPRGGGGTEGERKKPPSPSVGNFNFASAKKRQKTKAAAGRVAARGDRLEKFFFKPTFWRNIRQSQFSTQIAEDDPSGRGVLRALQPTADQVSQKFGFVFFCILFALHVHCTCNANKMQKTYRRSGQSKVRLCVFCILFALHVHCTVLAT